MPLKFVHAFIFYSKVKYLRVNYHMSQRSTNNTIEKKIIWFVSENS